MRRLRTKAYAVPQVRVPGIQTQRKNATSEGSTPPKKLKRNFVLLWEASGRAAHAGSTHSPPLFRKSRLMSALSTASATLVAKTVTVPRRCQYLSVSRVVTSRTYLRRVEAIPSVFLSTGLLMTACTNRVGPYRDAVKPES